MKEKIPIEKHIRALAIIFYAIIIFVVLYFLAGGILKIFTPFLLALIFAFIANPIVKFLEKHAKIPRRFGSVIAIFFLWFIVGSILFYGGKLAIREITEFSNYAFEFFSNLPEKITNAIKNWDSFNKAFPSIDFDMVLNSFNSVFENFFAGIPNTISNFAKAAAKAVPSTFVGIVVFFISTYFMLADKDMIIRFIKAQFDQNTVHKIKCMRDSVVGSVVSYVKAQLIIMSVVFVVLSVGLLIVKIPYAVLIALLVSFIDAIPILGTGTVFIPWAAICLIIGNYKLAVSLVIIYLAAMLTRQLIEPKIVSDQIGLYPLATLFVMYVGLNTLGFAGMIFGPVFLVMIMNLQRSGIVKLFKTVQKT